MPTDLTNLTILSFLLSCASLYLAGVYPDAIYISNLDKLDAKILPTWRRLAIGCSLFSISMLAVIYIPATFSLAQELSDNDNSLGLIDAIIFLGVLFTWVLSLFSTILCLVLESLRKNISERNRLKGMEGGAA